MPCAHQVACRPAFEKAAFSGFSEAPTAIAACAIAALPAAAQDTISATHVFPASLIYSRSFLEYVKKARGTITAIRYIPDVAAPGGERFDFLGAGAFLYLGWNAGTAIGVAAGDSLADPATLGLDAAFPALFLALLAPLLRSRTPVAAALLGAGIAKACARTARTASGARCTSRIGAGLSSISAIQPAASTSEGDWAPQPHRRC